MGGQEVFEALDLFPQYMPPSINVVTNYKLPKAMLLCQLMLLTPKCIGGCRWA